MTTRCSSSGTSRLRPVHGDFRMQSASGITLCKDHRRPQTFKLPLPRAADVAPRNPTASRVPAGHDPRQAGRRGREIPGDALTRQACLRQCIELTRPIAPACGHRHLQATKPLRLFRRVQTDPVHNAGNRGPDRRVERPLPEGRHASHPAPAIRHDRTQVVQRELLSFTHSTPTPRPPARQGINRARRDIYLAISKQRHELNGVPARTDRLKKGYISPMNVWSAFEKLPVRSRHERCTIRILRQSRRKRYHD